MDAAKRTSCGRLIPPPGSKESVTVEKRGKLFAMARHLDVTHPPPKCKRGEISTFSRKSRMRLLRFLATVKWGKIPTSLFVTLTYPTESDWLDKETRKRHRYLFHRYVENSLKREVPGIWRIEWKPRLSGPHRGMYCPHYHLLLFGVGYIHHAKIRQWWRQILKHKGPLATDVQGCRSAKRASIYVSKYVAKVEGDGSLDNGPYRNSDGKHYDYFRRDQIPREEQMILDNPTPEEVEWLVSRANEVCKWRLPEDDNGFVLLGDIADYVYTEFRQFQLDQRIC